MADKKIGAAISTTKGLQGYPEHSLYGGPDESGKHPQVCLNETVLKNNWINSAQCKFFFFREVLF